jgi:hypothetical protein
MMVYVRSPRYICFLSLNSGKANFISALRWATKSPPKVFHVVTFEPLYPRTLVGDKKGFNKIVSDVPVSSSARIGMTLFYESTISTIISALYRA